MTKITRGFSNTGTHKNKQDKEGKMKKKMSAILISTVLVIMAAMVGVTGVMASGPPLECTDDTYSVTPYGEPFPRQYDEDFDPDECENGWVWEYEITAENPKAMSAITKTHVYIPSLPPNVIDLLFPADVARGDGNTKSGKMYGNGIYNGVVATTTPLSGVSPSKVISICTDVNTYGTVSIGFETARTLTGCAAAESDTQGPLGGIIGPGFGPSQYAALETDKRIQLGASGGTVCAKKHPMTGCIKYFYSCEDTSQNPVSLPGQVEAPFFISGQIVDMGNLEDPLCREAIFARKGSPIQYWGYANGKYYCIGIYDPAVPSWTPAPCN